MRSTQIRDVELVQMAAFKLREAAERVARLAKETKTPSLRHLLTASAALLERHAQELQACLDTELPEHEPLTRPATRSRDRATVGVRVSA